ncbi:hypothetical protein [Dolosigranulum pigrum]|uniref:hypothetical protein n=1 Tax=Dolosigranulum pigrum TaxID=29394 RepID=UPI000DC5D500|nr:hypothetical protein [Dolosigranulum pigrum]RAN53961.1 hypothetical protein B8A31_02285 [Dolosigranulum pigrum]
MLIRRYTITEKSLEKAKQLLKSYDINDKTTQFGTDIVTMRVLFDEFNNRSQQMVGNSKELKKQSLVSALFEAIEPYINENRTAPLIRSGNIRMLSKRGMNYWRRFTEGRDNYYD